LYTYTVLRLLRPSLPDLDDETSWSMYSVFPDLSELFENPVETDDDALLEAAA
jgi:hypothetical protein